MHLFFNCELTDLKKDADLISIGIISEDGRRFYAEFVDYNREDCSEWSMKNLIPRLRFPVPKHGEEYFYKASRSVHNPVGNDLYSSWSLEMNGDKEAIRKELLKWLEQYDNIEFVSDSCYYDFTFLIDLLTDGGTVIDLPSNISPACHDINQDIAMYFDISDREAFGIDREEFLDRVDGDYVIGSVENAIHFAEVIRAVWNEV